MPLYTTKLQGSLIPETYKWPGGVIVYQIDAVLSEYLLFNYVTQHFGWWNCVSLLQLMQKKQSFKLQSTDSPTKLASRPRNERAKKITSLFRSLAGISIITSVIM